MRFWSNPETQDIICDIGKKEENYELEFIKMNQALYPIYKRAGRAGGLPLHSALIERGGSGLLLVASGGVGKSTCCRRIPYPWRPLCDDEVLILLDKDKTYKAYPFPTWSDYIWRRSQKTWNVGEAVGVSAIFFLERFDKDEIITIEQGRAAALISTSAQQGLFRNRQGVDIRRQIVFRKIFFQNACSLARAIPAFILRVSPNNGKFWENMEEALCSIKV